MSKGGPPQGLATEAAGRLIFARRSSRATRPGTRSAGSLGLPRLRIRGRAAFPAGKECRERPPAATRHCCYDCQGCSCCGTPRERSSDYCSTTRRAPRGRCLTGPRKSGLSETRTPRFARKFLIRWGARPPDPHLFRDQSARGQSFRVRRAGERPPAATRQSCHDCQGCPSSGTPRERAPDNSSTTRRAPRGRLTPTLFHDRH